MLDMVERRYTTPLCAFMLTTSGDASRHKKAT